MKELRIKPKYLHRKYFILALKCHRLHSQYGTTFCSLLNKAAALILISF